VSWKEAARHDDPNIVTENPKDSCPNIVYINWLVIPLNKV